MPNEVAALSRVTCRDSLRQSQICLCWNLLSFLLAGGQIVALVMMPSALSSKRFAAIDAVLVLTLALDLAIECNAQGLRAFICCCGRATSAAAAAANVTQCFGVMISLFVGPSLISLLLGKEDNEIVVLSLLLLLLRCGVYLILFGLAQVRGFQLQGGMSSAAEWDIVFTDATESGTLAGAGAGGAASSAWGGGGSSAQRGNYGAVATRERAEI